MAATIDPIFYFNVYSPITSLSFCRLPSHNAEGEMPSLIIGCGSGKVHLWNINSRRPEHDIHYALEKAGNPILWLNVTKQDGLHLVLQNRFSDKIVLLTYTLKSWVEQEILTLPDKYVGFCKGDLACDNTWAFPTGENGFVLANIEKNQVSIAKVNLVTSVIKIEDCGMITSIKFTCINKNRHCIFTTFESGNVFLYEIVDSCNHKLVSILCRFQLSPNMTPLSIDFDEKKGRGVIAGSEDSVISFQLVEQDKAFNICMLKIRNIPLKGISSVVIRRDQKIVIAGGWDSTVKLFSWLKPEILKPLGALKFHSQGVEVVIATEDSKLLAAGSKDGKVSFWAVY